MALVKFSVLGGTEVWLNSSHVICVEEEVIHADAPYAPRSLVFHTGFGEPTIKTTTVMGTAQQTAEALNNATS